MTIYPEDPYTDEDLFGKREKADDEIYDRLEDYEDGWEDIDVSEDDYERRRIA